MTNTHTPTLAPGDHIDLNVGPADSSESIVVRVSLCVDDDAEPFLSVRGVNCDLEGEMPGEYYFAPLSARA